jgi:predicted CDP-diglyceride synthetase/phosphatidate cytidylyltransferase
MGFLEPIPPIILVFALVLLMVAPVSFLASRRGGRFRGLPGWIGFWTFFAMVLACLSRADRWIGFPLVGLLLFAGLRQYFSLTPVRPHDRWALVIGFLLVPFSLWLAFRGDPVGFHAAVPIAILLVIPVVLATGANKQGLLDAMGRIGTGAAVFVYCGGFLGLMAHEPVGTLELFGIVALVAEIPQRFLGRSRGNDAPAVHLASVGAGVAAAMVAGATLGPWVGLTEWIGAGAGALVALATAAGALLAASVADDLDQSATSAVLGRAAFLDRTMPTLLAAPVYYHYLRAMM